MIGAPILYCSDANNTSGAFPKSYPGGVFPRSWFLHGSGVLEVMLDRQSAAFRAEFLENVEKVNHIIVVANHYREYMEGLGFSNVHHIPNGIEGGKFQTR